MELQGQWAELLPRAKQALIDVIDSGRFILGPQVKAFEEEAAAAPRRRPRRRRRERHRRAGARAARARRRARRRGHLPGLHLLRHGRGDRARRRDAGVRRHRAPGRTTSTRRRSRPPSRRAPAPWSPCTCSATRPTSPALRALCDRHGLALVEDAAQAFGATSAARLRPLGDVATFSFFPTKNLPTFGDGGLVTTPRRRRRRARAARCASTARGTSRRSSRSATTRASTSCRRRCCACSCRGSTAGTPRRQAAAARYATLGLGEHVDAAAAPRRRTLPPLHGAASPSATRVVAGAAGGAASAAASTTARPLHLQPVFAHLGYREGDLPVTEALRPRGPRAADVPDAHRGPAAGGRGAPSRSPPRATRVRVWVDLTNAPHAVVLAPLVACPRGARRHRRGDRPRLRADASRIAAPERARPDGHRPPRRRRAGRQGAGRGRPGRRRCTAGRAGARLRRRPGARLDRPADRRPRAAHPGDDDVRLRVRRPAALAQLPARPPDAGARGDPAGPPGAATARARRGSCATRASRRSTRWPDFEPDPAVPGGARRRTGELLAVLRPPPELALYHRFENACSRTCWSASRPTDGVDDGRAAAHRAAGRRIRALGAGRRGRARSARWTGRAWSRAPTWSSPRAAR